MDGWIKLHRKMQEWGWYRDSHMVHLFIHLLLTANHKEKVWNGITINRGQLITGRKQLAEDTGISERSIRTCLNKLKSTSEISIKPTNKFSIITICNYDSYQEIKQDTDQQNNQQVDQQLTSKRPASDHKQECKELKNDKNKTQPKKSAVAQLDFIDEIVNEFAKEYEAVFGFKYEITNKGKNRGAAAKLLYIYKKQYPASDTEGTLAGLRSFFCACMNINDAWLRSHITLPLIACKFNEFQNLLKNDKHKVSGATGNELVALLAGKLGVKQ